ncbi:di-/tricarboxylate transporter [Desulfitobacterium dichloroeliminans LMG P-21439]|uniref:Sodium-dependent dicarboxylate transporter SdcS n=2 Tax=Desulfitobacterium dichloroeliminans TaxID=233055 RepID=L0F7T3_DESDL|nr:di-/tricarboxylate transporter [Desulfitobacterium dichloroeliminans LMG P-21439]
MALWSELNELKNSLSEKEFKNEKTKRTIGFFLGPILFLLLEFVIAPPSGLTDIAWRCLGVTLWAIVWWVCEPFAVPTTSLLVILLLPILNILPPEKVYPNLGHTAIFMVIGAFILVESLGASGLGKRIALWTVTRPSVNSVWRMAIAVSLVTMILSSVMPNIPVTILMISLTIPLLDNLGAPFRGKLTTLLLLSTAFPSVIGGIITPIGATAPNFLLIGVTQNVLGTSIPFGLWFITCLPVALLMFVVMLALFAVFFKKEASNAMDIDAARVNIVQDYKNLGKVTRRELYAGIAIVLALILWVIPGMATMTLGAQNPTTLILNKYLSMEKVALLVALLLLIVPLDWKKREYTIGWKDASKAVDFGLLIFIAVTFTLPAAFTETGLLKYITGILQGAVGDLPTIMVVFILVTIVSLLSQLGLQMPLIALSVPITASLIGAIGGNPLAAVLAVGMAAVGGTYLIPISTPVHMVPFSTGRIPMNDFVKAGLPFTIAWVFALAFIMYPLASMIIKF